MAELQDFIEYRSKTNFMEIVDVDFFNTIYDMSLTGDIGDVNHGLPLHVLQSKGVEVKQDFTVNATDLNTDKSNLRYKNFMNTGNAGITFKVDVIIGKDEKWGYGIDTKAEYAGHGNVYPAKRRIITWLNSWYTHMRPLYVVSDAIDIPNGTYIISSNPSRTQSHLNYTVWSLEFTTFRPLELHKWRVSQSIIDATTPKKNTNNTTTASASSNNTALKNCSNNMTYSKTEKKTECNKILQQKLYELGFLSKDQVDGWYGPVTMEAVKKFQRWHNSKGGNLLVDGVAGPVTVGAMCKY